MCSLLHIEHRDHETEHYVQYCKKKYLSLTWKLVKVCVYNVWTTKGTGSCQQLNRFPTCRVHKKSTLSISFKAVDAESECVQGGVKGLVTHVHNRKTHCASQIDDDIQLGNMVAEICISLFDTQNRTEARISLFDTQNRTEARISLSNTHCILFLQEIDKIGRASCRERV